MTINLNDMFNAFSFALDTVEQELVGITTNHGKRVAYMSLLAGKVIGLDNEQLIDLSICCVLHDNALAEYIKEEFSNGIDVKKTVKK